MIPTWNKASVIKQCLFLSLQFLRTPISSNSSQILLSVPQPFFAIYALRVFEEYKTLPGPFWALSSFPISFPLPWPHP